jgi:protein TonB
MVLKPPNITTAPVANLGDAAANGASDLPGPGQGAGGIGNGFGGGGEGGLGNGRGAGRGEPPVEPPRRIGGRLGYRDAPEGLIPEGREGHVGVLYAVNPDGRVSDCEIERSSGIPALDGLVCRLIEQRFVFRPARDRFGRPVRSRIAETHSFFGHPE